MEYTVIWGGFLIEGLSKFAPWLIFTFSYNTTLTTVVIMGWENSQVSMSHCLAWTVTRKFLFLE